jgi:hypothetical protein
VNRKSLLFYVLFLAILVIFSTTCSSPPEDTQEVIETTETKTEPSPLPTLAYTPKTMPSSTPNPSPTIPVPTPVITGPSYRAQIKISTTSDWTTFRLVAGGNWHDITVASSSEGALSADFDGDQFSLSQTIDSAKAGESIELVADAFFTELDPVSPLVFEIERGHVGSTQVEISSYQDGTPREVAVLSWGRISAGNRNASG